MVLTTIVKESLAEVTLSQNNSVCAGSVVTPTYFCPESSWLRELLSYSWWGETSYPEEEVLFLGKETSRKPKNWRLFCLLAF